VAQPIFAGGRLEAQSAAAQARERAALAEYQQAIRNAFGEVRAALSAQSRSRESYDAESAGAAALGETLRLARLRYQNGVARPRPARKTAAGNAPPWDARARRGVRAIGSPSEPRDPSFPFSP